MKRKAIYGILFSVVVVVVLFVKNKIIDGKFTCTGVITDYIDEWEYDSDCFIVEESKNGCPWIVYESLEEINNRFHKDLDYGDLVWVSYTTNGYEISPGLMEVAYIVKLRKGSTTVFATENISKIEFSFGPKEKREVSEEDLEEIVEWLETFRAGDRVKRNEEQPPGTNSVSVRIEYQDGTIVENGLDTVKVNKKEYYLIYADAPEAYLRLYYDMGK